MWAYSIGFFLPIKGGDILDSSKPMYDFLKGHQCDNIEAFDWLSLVQGWKMDGQWESKEIEVVWYANEFASTIKIWIQSRCRMNTNSHGIYE